MKQTSESVLADLCAKLAQHQITTYDEVALRKELEARVETYTLFKLAPWPARRWKCHYRLMMNAGMYDAQSVAEAYALGILAAIERPPEQHHQDDKEAQR